MSRFPESLQDRGANVSESVPYRPLGSTGEKVSCIGLGGYHLGQSHLEEADAIKLFHAAVDRGINFSDNSWDYNQGESERRVGKALRGYRDRVFVMTKFDGRTKGSALQQLDESLQRLQVDHVDLWQFHENIRLEDPDRFFCGRRRRRSYAGSEAGRQNPLRGIYRSQRSERSPSNARNGRQAQFPVRHGADASERNGRSFSEFWRQRSSSAGRQKNCGTGNEIDGGHEYPEKQNGDASRMPSICPEPAYFRGYHRHRQHAHSRSGLRSRQDLRQTHKG